METLSQADDGIVNWRLNSSSSTLCGLQSTKMSGVSAACQIELEVERIRELSRGSRHAEALAAVEALAAKAPENRDVLYLIAANQ